MQDGRPLCKAGNYQNESVLHPKLKYILFLGIVDIFDNDNMSIRLHINAYTCVQEDNSAAVKKQAEGASNPMYQVRHFFEYV